MLQPYVELYPGDEWIIETTGGSITWALSDDYGIARVSLDKITAVAPGRARISVSSASGATQTVYVTVLARTTATTTTTTTTTTSATTSATTPATTTTTAPAPPELDYIPGDVNGDGLVDAIDASEVLAEYARISAGDFRTFSKKQILAADVFADDYIDAVDASAILAYYAYISTNQDGRGILEWLGQNNS